MSQHEQGPGSSGAGSKFHIVQPLRDLESNWAIDLAKNLEEYLLKIYSGEITGVDDGRLSVNFAEAALLLQGSIQVYSRKVEYLYSLVLQALEFISKKSQPEQPENASQQPEGGVSTAPGNEDDLFWNVDNIPVEAKNVLDVPTTSDAPSDYLVKLPSDLVVLEGDCLDTIGDGGELESYLLATNDLYRDFILLDSRDAAAIDVFLKGGDEVSKEHNGVNRRSSWPSKYCTPTRQTGGSAHDLSVGKRQDANSDQSPCVDHGFKFIDHNNNSHPTPCKIPESTSNESRMDGRYPGFGDLDDLSDDDDDDPWKPLNPHELGNLKVKPFRKVKAYKKEGINSSRQGNIIREFPLARLHGTISLDLTQLWETHSRATEAQPEPHAPLYEKLRQSLVLGGLNFDGFSNPAYGNECNKYDDENSDQEPPDFDTPETTYVNEDLPGSPKMHDDGSDHFHTHEAYGDDSPTPGASLEDLCRSHLDSLLARISETEKQTELASRVSSWKQRVEQILEEQESRSAFNIHDYGERVLDKLSLAIDCENTMSFTDVVGGQEKHNVARTFSALLQLINSGNVDLQRFGGNDDEHTCYTASKPFHVRLLRHAWKQQEIQLQSSKRKPKSLIKNVEMKDKKGKSGKENRRPVSPSCVSTSNSRSSEKNYRFSLRLGKVGVLRSSPVTRRKRPKVVEHVDMHSVD